MASTRKPFWAIRSTDDTRSEEGARRLLSRFSRQRTFIGGRVLPPPGRWLFFRAAGPWRVESLHLDTGTGSPLPAGCARVLVRPSMFGAYGLDEMGKRCK